ncbi:MAG: N-acetylmuramoyl-L-alanine amidase [Chloroflexi bacterium]|nr:N-acetylmuramoyl-L-alanine amidase [Chloroflexota bacterium]
MADDTDRDYSPVNPSPPARRTPAQSDRVDAGSLRDDDFAVWTVDTGALDDLSSEEAAEHSYMALPPAPSHPARRSTGPASGSPRPPRARSQPPRPSSSGLPNWWIALRTVVVVTLTAVLVSTIFSLWTRPTFFTDEFRAGLNQVQATQHVISIQPSPLPTETREIRIGVIAGHSGTPQDPNFDFDPGAVCDDGLTELSINESVARGVVAALRREGYTVDLLQEFDPILANYDADVLVSIHTNDCRDYGEGGSGYAVAAALARQSTRGKDEYLLNCLITQYGATTALPHHSGLTYDMTEYHNFDEVSQDTPTAIIELGFMRLNREILTQRQDLVAQGVSNGIRCFLHPELYGQITPTLTP